MFTPAYIAELGPAGHFDTKISLPDSLVAELQLDAMTHTHDRHLPL